jgi:branched-subunit amino acid ABC-type transport system permease component
MIDPVILLQILWTGLTMSSYYVLFSVAFALTLKVEKLWNFAQAGLMGIAFFTMYFCVQGLELPAWTAAAIGLIVTIGISLAVEHFAIETLRRRKSSGLTFFIFTLVFAQLVAYLLTVGFGTEPQTIYPSVMSRVRILGGVAVTNWDIQAVVVTTALLTALFALLRLARDGQFMLAVADNAKLAEFYGISARRAYMLSAGISAVLITAGVYLYGTRAGITPDVPLGLVLTAVIATLVGGVGRVFSAAMAAVGLALLQSFSILIIAAKWQSLLLYAVLFGALALFPRGLTHLRFRRMRFAR